MVIQGHLLLVWMNTLIHVTSADDGDFAHALRSASVLLGHDELPHQDVTIVPHRQAVRFVTPDSPMAADVHEAIERGVTITAGATCFEATDRPREALAGVTIVPSGVSEVVRLQSEGYNYVKVP